MSGHSTEKDALVQRYPESCWCGYDPEDLPASDVFYHLQHTTPISVTSPATTGTES